MEKVEKVVRLPIRPVVRPFFRGPSKYVSEREVKNPSNKHPTTFAIKVPTGNPSE